MTKLNSDLNARVKEIWLEADAGDGRDEIENEAITVACQQCCDVRVTVLNIHDQPQYDLRVDYKIIASATIKETCETQKV